MATSFPPGTASEGASPGGLDVRYYGDLLWRIIRTEEMRVVIFIERQARRDSPRHARMAGQGRMFGLRERQPGLEFLQQRCRYNRDERVKCQCAGHEFSPPPVLPKRITKP